MNVNLSADRPGTDGTANAPATGCVLIVDDHPLFRAGLALILGEDLPAGGELVQAGTLTEALSVPQPVQVVLLDVELPGVNGIDGLGLLRRRWPRAAIIVLSAHDSGALVTQALQKGANLFVSKAAAPDCIRAAVAQGLREGHQLGAAAAQGGALIAGGNGAAGAARPSALSARQIEVLSLLCEGLSNKGIANRLALSENTVRNHVVSVLRHFNANTRTEAAMAAQRSGVVQWQPPR
ncbi:MAG: response regulator [Ramlibacter sp.]